MALIYVNDSRYEDLLQIELLWRADNLNYYYEIVYDIFMHDKSDMYLPFDTKHFIRVNKNEFWIENKMLNNMKKKRGD